MVIKVKVKIFDENHEADLEKSINDFLKNNEIEVIDIKYQVSVSVFSEEQVFCFSAMIIYCWLKLINNTTINIEYKWKEDNYVWKF